MTTEREIKTISFGRAAREKIGMYLSADQEEALSLGLREIYVNSLDAIIETNQPKGKVTISIDSIMREIEVIDNGPGIPNAPREDGTPSLVAAFTLPHTGSHFDGRDVNAIGAHGIGGSVVAHTSSFFWVQSCDKKEIYQATFDGSDEGAILKSWKPTKQTTNKHGVHIKYIPDVKIYGDVWFNKETLIADLSEMMKFYPGIELTLIFDGTKKLISYPNGLKTPETMMYYQSEDLIISLSLGAGQIKPFGNRLFLPRGGAFFSHFRSQMTRTVNDLTGLKLSGPHIQSAFHGYVAIFVKNPLFSNQSKTEISNKEVNTEISTAIKDLLTKFSKTPEWERTIKTLETELKAEQAAQRARDKVKNALSEIDKGAKKKVLVADKLKDCLYHGENSFLFISEGNAAQGSLNLGRDTDNVATFPIRGKFVNTLKNTQENYLANEELIQIAQILGCGLFEKYDAKKLRYGKVGIAVDADSDGLSIANLLITFFYVCMPNFIKEGRLYWIKSPLYYDDKGNYIFNEEDWNKVRSKKGFVRAKGLGELSPKAVEEAMFGKHKEWVQLKPANWALFSQKIKMLMGTDVAARRDFIFDKVDFEKIKFL